MNKSLEQRVRNLEAAVQRLEQRPEPKPVEIVVQVPEKKAEPKVEAVGRAMCPKCGVKPNYFFHVKTCRGQKDGDKATDRQRDQS